MKFLLQKSIPIIISQFFVVCFLSFGFFGLTTEAANVPASTSNPATVPAKVNPPSSGVRIDTKINNPLGNDIVDVPSFIQAIIRIVLLIGVPIVTLAIIYSGYLFIKAQGVPAELEKAKKNFVGVLIGAAVLFGAFVISQAIKGTVDQIIRENK